MIKLALRCPLAAAGLALALGLSATAPASAAFKDINGYEVYKYLGFNLQGFPLPGGKIGYLIGTMRKPVIVTSRKQAVLLMTYNGIDDAKWPYHRLLARMLKYTCAVKDEKVGRTLVKRVYAAKSVTPPKRLGGNGGTLVHRRYTTIINGCRITMEVKGARWHRISATVESAA